MYLLLFHLTQKKKYFRVKSILKSEIEKLNRMWVIKVEHKCAKW
jgi:hypothetical protein